MTRVQLKMSTPMYSSCSKRYLNFLSNLSGSFRGLHPPLHLTQRSKKNQHAQAILPCLQLLHHPNIQNILPQDLITPQLILQSCRHLLHIVSTAVLCFHLSLLAPHRYRQLPPPKLQATRVVFATLDQLTDTPMFLLFLLPTALHPLPNIPPT